MSMVLDRCHLNFGCDVGGCLSGVGRFEDGAAYDEVGRAGSDGIARRHDAGLVSDGRSRGTDARGDDSEGRAEFATQFASFVRRGDDAPASGVAGERSQAQDLSE